jgi:hypothetical protein
MTDSERLIELLRTVDNMRLMRKGFSECADYLLANGVIVPPCKAGDTVYMITPNGNIRNLTILSIDIELENKEVKMSCSAVYEFEGKPCYMQIQSFKFGKTVFLTKELAEKALAERIGK